MKGRVLVTGGAGFVGSRLSMKLAFSGYSVLIADNLSNSTMDNVPKHPNIKFLLKDVRDDDIKNLLHEHEINYIFHLAAVISIEESVKNPLKTHTNNLDATINLLESAKQYKKISKFIFSSSCAVYGQKPDISINEEDSISPVTPYAIDKYSSEIYIGYYSREYGIPYVILRYFNIYGPPKSKITPYSGVIQIFREKISKGMDIDIYGTGNQKRDFIHIDDIINANVFALESEMADNNTINIGTGQSITINKLAEIIKGIYNANSNIGYKPARKGDIIYSSADIGKARSLGFYPKTDIESGLQKA